MDDREFLDQIKAKIERLTGTKIRISLDTTEENQMKVDWDLPVPEVTLGFNVLEYSGFARMSVEYAVASVRERRNLGPLEFHVLLARN